MILPNRINTRCGVCKAAVLVGAGWSEVNNGQWTTRCQPCSGHVATAPTVQVSMWNGRVAFKIDGFLGPEMFSTFRRCLEGSKFDFSAKVNTIGIQDATRAIQALVTSGMLVNVAADVRATLTVTQESVRADRVAAGNRADQVDAALKTRGLNLYNFQRHGINWLSGCKGALLADDMGLGKTVQAITALPENAPVLVICPAVAKGVWSREIAKWRADLRVTILNGRGSFRWPAPGEVVVTNYDVLPDVGAATSKDTALLDLAPQGCVVIADEAHVLKGGKRTKRGLRFQTLASTARKMDGRTWLLTATPLLNRPQETWNVLAAADLAHTAFSNWNNFVRVFNGRPGEWGGYTWGTPDAEAAAMCLRRVSLRRSKIEVLTDLPAKRLSFRTVDLTARDTKALDAIVAKLGGTENLAAALRSAMAGSDKDLCFTEISRARAILAKAKIPAMMEVIESFEEQGEPLVVFSAHRAPIDALHGRAGWAVITGDTAPEERTSIENDFQNGKLLGVACTIKAGGVAITLTRAANSLFVDREWTPALNEQAQDRIFRIGQLRGVCCDHLIADHVLDQRIADLLEEKTNIVDNSIQASNVGADDNVVVETVLDLSAADAAVKAEADRVAAAKGLAAEEAARRLDRAAELAAKEAEKEAEETKKRRYEAARQRAVARGIVVRVDDPTRRPARTEAERWAEKAVVHLAGQDSDFAAVLNDVGFNKPDVSDGHWFSKEVQMGRGLTSAQWLLMTSMCRKYHRQVGECPGSEVSSDEV